MPPKSACPLDQRANRREIGDHNVEVEVERRLDHLRGDQNPIPRVLDPFFPNRLSSACSWRSRSTMAKRAWSRSTFTPAASTPRPPRWRHRRRYGPIRMPHPFPAASLEQVHCIIRSRKPNDRYGPNTLGQGLDDLGCTTRDRRDAVPDSA